MNTIQSVDFSQDRSQLCKSIDDAFAHTGFLIAHNIGIDQALLQGVFQKSHQFFSGSQAAKDCSAYGDAKENFGYQGLLQENLDPSAPADIKETFTLRNISQHSAQDPRWPSAPFRDLMIKFHSNVMQAATHLQELLADILSVPTDFFTSTISGENVSLRLLYYPSTDTIATAPGQLGAGAHTDYGLLTFLFQDAVGGLQVRGLDGGKDGEWIDVKTQPGSVVINCGDLLMRWTNNRYPSTLHRVQPVTGTHNRLSIALFLDPDNDTVVAPVPSCMDADHPQMFPTVTAGEHILNMLNASHKERYNT